PTDDRAHPYGQPRTPGRRTADEEVPEQQADEERPRGVGDPDQPAALLVGPAAEHREDDHDDDIEHDNQGTTHTASLPRRVVCPTTSPGASSGTRPERVRPDRPMTARVQYAVEGPLARTTLDSPHNRNALSRQLVTELLEALERARDDDAVRVVLIAATGTVFCSGADLSEASTVPMEEGARGIVEVQRRILALPKPVVTRLQGAVRAGGTGI